MTHPESHIRAAAELALAAKGSDSQTDTRKAAPGCPGAQSWAESSRGLAQHDLMAARGSYCKRRKQSWELAAHGALSVPATLQRLLGRRRMGARPAPASGDPSPGHELVQLLLVLLVLGGDGVLGLLLHGLHEVLHVLEGVDLHKTGAREPLSIRPGLMRENPPII